jgi:hypothetical protein
MQKCPIKPKTSALAAGKGQQSLSKQRTWGSLAGLAKLQGCSQRTMREWCKKGLIREAYQTRGRQWRIQTPLSDKTRWELAKRRDDWPFKGKIGKDGDLLDGYEWAELLSLAAWYKQPVGEPLPVLTMAEDVANNGVGSNPIIPIIKEPDDEKARMARKIQIEIVNRLKKKKSFSDMILLGWVYQFWLKNKRRPTVSEISQLIGISRYTFYQRGYTTQGINKAYYDASGESKRDLPHPSGLDAVQIQNLNAKKKTSFKSLQSEF